MPSRQAASAVWSGADKGAARTQISGEAVRKCVKVSASGEHKNATIDGNCMAKAVPKGTFKGLWTD